MLHGHFADISHAAGTSLAQGGNMPDSKYKVGDTLLTTLGNIPCQICRVQFQGTIDPTEYYIRYIDSNGIIQATRMGEFELKHDVPESNDRNYILKVVDLNGHVQFSSGIFTKEQAERIAKEKNGEDTGLFSYEAVLRKGYVISERNL